MRCCATDINRLQRSLPMSSTEIIRKKGVKAQTNLANFLLQRVKQLEAENALLRTGRQN